VVQLDESIHVSFDHNSIWLEHLPVRINRKSYLPSSYLLVEHVDCHGESWGAAELCWKGRDDDKWSIIPTIWCWISWCGAATRAGSLIMTDWGGWCVGIARLVSAGLSMLKCGSCSTTRKLLKRLLAIWNQKSDYLEKLRRHVFLLLFAYAAVFLKALSFLLPITRQNRHPVCTLRCCNGVVANCRELSSRHHHHHR